MGGGFHGIGRDLNPALQAAINDLDQENDPYLKFYEKINLARWVKNRGDFQAAAKLLADAAEQQEFPELAKEATGELALLSGSGPWQSSLEELLPQILSQTLDPALYASMFFGMGAYRWSRALFASKLGRAGFQNLLGSGGLRFLAGTGALGMEATVFASSHRALRKVLTESQHGETSHPQEILGAFLLLGSLRLSHGLFQSLSHWALGPPVFNQKTPWQTTLWTQSGTLGGILLGQKLGEFAGLSPKQSWDNSLSRGIATLIHFSMVGRIFHPGGKLLDRWVPGPKLSPSLPALPATEGPMIINQPLLMTSQGGHPNPAPLGRWVRNLRYENAAGESRDFNYSVNLQDLSQIQVEGFEAQFGSRENRELSFKVVRSYSAKSWEEYFPIGTTKIDLDIYEGHSSPGRATIYFPKEGPSLYRLNTREMKYPGAGSIFLDWLATQTAYANKNLNLIKIVNPKIFIMVRRLRLFDPKDVVMEVCYEDHSGWEVDTMGSFNDWSFVKAHRHAHFHNLRGRPNPELIQTNL